MYSSVKTIQGVSVYGSNCQRSREFERYGKKAETYDLVGRVHLDPLDLYPNIHMRSVTATD